MNKTSVSNINCLKVSEDVISKIAEIAVSDISGVHSITKHKHNLANVLTKSDQPAEINIKVTNDSVEVSLGIIVSGNCKVKSVAETVQKRIKDDVQNMTGIAVTKVDVHIDGIVFETE